MSVSPDEERHSSGHEQTTAACGPSSDSIDQLDRVLLEQTLEAQRGSSASLTSARTALVVVLVTLVGFAVDRKSWGLALVSAMVYPIVLQRLRAHRTMTDLLLDSAEATERRVRGKCADVSAAIVPVLRAAERSRQSDVVVVCLAMLVHIAITIGLFLWADEFTFTGS